MNKQRGGAWIPTSILRSWETLRSRSASWNILLAVAHQQFRYGGTEAKITMGTVAERTGRSLSTVKRAFGELREIGVLLKLGHGRWMVKEAATTAPLRRRQVVRDGVIVPTPSRVQRTDPFPTLLLSLSENMSKDAIVTVFSPKQLRVINDLLKEFEEVSRNVLSLDIVYDGTPTTVGEICVNAVVASDRRLARDFVKALLSLRKDKRVVGEELVDDAMDREE